MPRLKAEHKAFIVQRLACFDSPSDVMDAVREEFGIDMARQSIEAYDPNKWAGRNLSQKYRDMFEKTREAFLEDTSDIAISHKTVRLRRLERMIERAERKGNLVLAQSLLEQAAKESGGAYTNTRILRGDTQPVNVVVNRPGKAGKDGA